MNDSKYRYILYVIIVVILSTIGIQAFWNYKNYQASKQQLINDVQASLDDAVSQYFTNLAEETTLALKFEGDSQKNAFDNRGILEQVTAAIDESNGTFKSLDSLNIQSVDGITLFRGNGVDSLIHSNASKNKNLTPEDFKVYVKELRAKDSIEMDVSSFELLTQQVVISISNDTLDIAKIDSLLQLDLDRKRINISYNLLYKDDLESDSISWNEHFNYEKNRQNNKLKLTASSHSNLLPKNSMLSIQYENTTWVVLTRIIWGIIISTLLVLAVISCLFYLLGIIRHQKQLAEVKNDLISNITHEFKTPIATISVALESIKNFNAIESKEKTMNYLDMSSDQLEKLNIMVEKLLETSTLDSENLQLNIDHTDIVELIKQLIDKHNMQKEGPQIQFTSSPETIVSNVDSFHFENAINNILDNAIKYGGQDISVEITKHKADINISISDSGSSLNKNNKDKIFEKFYRVPKGNTHDVKGFGIGLYYTKKIIEKHDGIIQLHLNDSKTTFQITLPNA